MRSLAKKRIPSMVLIYCQSTTKNGTGNRLKKAIHGVVSEEQTETYRSIESLYHRLFRPISNFKIAVILASDRDELLGLLSIQDLFRNLRIILILPDREKDTVSKGLRLYPRFFTYADSNFKDVAAVLEKMMESYPKFYGKEVKIK